MKLWPSFEFRISTGLDRWKTISLLQENTEPRKYLRWSRTHRLFQGEVSSEGFILTRIIHYRNSFLPVLHGDYLVRSSKAKILTGKPFCAAERYGEDLLFRRGRDESVNDRDVVGETGTPLPGELAAGKHALRRRPAGRALRAGGPAHRSLSRARSCYVNGGARRGPGQALPLCTLFFLNPDPVFHRLTLPHSSIAPWCDIEMG